MLQLLLQLIQKSNPNHSAVETGKMLNNVLAAGHQRYDITPKHNIVWGSPRISQKSLKKGFLTLIRKRG